MKKLCALLLLVTSGCFTACKKCDKTPEPLSQETTVYGRVVMKNTDIKATNEICTVRAYRNYPTGAHGIYEARLIAETTTDTNGNYRLQFKAPDLDPLRYFVRLETSIMNHFDPSLTELKIIPGNSQELKLEYIPHAWIKLHVRNVNPGVNDLLHLPLGGTQNYYIWGESERGLVFLAEGNSENTINCFLTRQEVRKRLTFKVYVSAFDTAYYLLEY